MKNYFIKLTATQYGHKNLFNKYFLDYTGLSFEELNDNGLLKIIHSPDLEKIYKYGGILLKPVKVLIWKNEFAALMELSGGMLVAGLLKKTSMAIFKLAPSMKLQQKI